MLKTTLLSTLLFAALVARPVHAATFEQACRALPQVHAAVTPLPVVVDDQVRDDDMRSMTIRTTGEESLRDLATVGTTRADRTWELSYALDALTDPQTGRVCYRPAVRVAIGYEPMQISVAHPFRSGTCAYDTIVGHERGHIAIYDRFLPGAARAIEDSLDDTLSGRIRYAEDLQTAHADMRRLLHTLVSSVVRREMSRSQALHDRFDSIEESLHLLNACGGEIRRGLNQETLAWK